VKFARTDLSKLRSQRANIDRKISKAQWRLDNDPLVDTVRMSVLTEALTATSGELTTAIDVEIAVDERRALRQALLANCR
jgi:hypothetical protein